MAGRLKVWNGDTGTWDYVAYSGLSFPVSDDVAAASGALVRIKRAADTQYRRVVAEDADYWGSGSAAPDVKLYRAGADELKIDDIFNLNGARIRGGGGTLPSSPANKDLFFYDNLWTWLQYRTDNGWNKWFQVGVPMHSMVPDGAMPFNPAGVAGILRGSPLIHGNFDGYLFAGLYGSLYVITPNDGSNYWQMQMVRVAGASGTSLGSFDTSGVTQQSWTKFNVGSSTLLTPAQVDEWELQITGKVGAPGAIYAVGDIHARGYKDPV